MCKPDWKNNESKLNNVKAKACMYLKKTKKWLNNPEVY